MKESIEARNDANYTENAKTKVFISWKSYEDLQITILSFKEFCKLFSEQGIPYSLSEIFCQDDLENYFGKQRAIGRRSDNLTVNDFRYSDNTVKNQFLMRLIIGNVQGPAEKFSEMCIELLPKRRK